VKVSVSVKAWLCMNYYPFVFFLNAEHPLHVSFKSRTFWLIIEKFSGSLINDKSASGSVLNGQFSVFRFAHSVKRSASLNVLEGILEPTWKRLGAVEIVPWKLGMIKTELIGMECVFNN